MDNPDPELVVYLSEHDVACSTCWYNLRGIRTLVCPECGMQTAFNTLEELMEQTRVERFEEHNVFGFYMMITKWLSVLLIFDAAAIAFITWRNGQLDVLIPIAVLMLALINFGIRYALYVRSSIKLSLYRYTYDSYRERYGVFAIVAIVPVIWLSGIAAVKLFV